MRAVTVVPGEPFSAELSQIDEPALSDGTVLVESLAVGVCGTDLDIVAGRLGSAPPGETALVLGHEAVGRVVDAPAGSGLVAGDLVVPFVRRPDPLLCYSCAAGEWDSCRNGRYTEHGIKGRHGFMRDRYRVEPEALVTVEPDLGVLAVLLEPTAIVAKAWEQIERVGRRATWQPLVALVVGAGPIGMLAALLGVQEGLEVHVLDTMATGTKPELVRELGASYHVGAIEEVGTSPDVIIDCTGAPERITEAVTALGTGGVLCLTGNSAVGALSTLDLGLLARDVVHRNLAIVGSVNSNRRHYARAASALEQSHRHWLARIISRRVAMEQFRDGLRRGPHEVKVIVEMSS